MASGIQFRRWLYGVARAVWAHELTPIQFIEDFEAVWAGVLLRVPKSRPPRKNLRGK